MSHYDYKASQEIAEHDFHFYALLMAAMIRADSDNFAKFKAAWPLVADELYARYHAPGGILPTDQVIA